MRFVDRRTSVLMRRLRDKEELIAEIGADGSILVEDHYVGRLDGFRFTPDTSGDGIHGRAARHAAAKVLAHRACRPRRRARRRGRRGDLAEAQRPHRVARNRRSPGSNAATTALKPKHSALGRRALSAPDRERVQNACSKPGLRAELRRQAQATRSALSEAADLSGLARGLAFRLTETSRRASPRRGVEPRSSHSIKARAPSSGQYGVRFGAFNIYIPALLKPAAADLLLLLWALHPAGITASKPMPLPARPQQGLTSVEADAQIPEPYWRAAGFHVAGARAVRIDMLERLVRPYPRAHRLPAAEGGAAAAAGGDRRRRLPGGARTDVGGRLLRRRVRLDPESARLQAASGGGSRLRPSRSRKCRMRPLRLSCSTRFGARASARKRATTSARATSLNMRSARSRAGASGNSSRSITRRQSARRSSIRLSPRSKR